MKFHGWLDKDMKYLLKYQPQMVINLDALVKGKEEAPQESSKSSISQISIEKAKKEENTEATTSKTQV